MSMEELVSVDSGSPTPCRLSTVVGLIEAFLGTSNYVGLIGLSYCCYGLLLSVFCCRRSSKFCVVLVFVRSNSRLN